MSMLEMTLATRFVPGTNLPADAVGANWAYMLPDLRLVRVLCVGLPPIGTLRTLSQLAREVVVTCQEVRMLQNAEAAVRQGGLLNVYPISVPYGDGLPFPDHRVDLALIAGRSGARRLRRDYRLRAELQRVLKPEGLIYLELGRFADGWFSGKAPEKLTAQFGTSQTFWLTPTVGKQMHTAVPQSDRQTIDHFLSQGIDCPTINRPVVRQAERFLHARPMLGRLGRRRGLLLGSTAAAVGERPPRYIQEIASAAGIDIRRHRWGMSAPGKYPSRKVLFFLFDGNCPRPQYLVKLTRNPQLNPRLENECRALRLLSRMEIGDGDTVPQVAFFGHHAKLAIVGETAIDGVPFDRRSSFTAECPIARDVIDRLTELGAATAQSGAATPQAVAAGLQTLFDRFKNIYDLTAEENASLERQIAVLGSSSEPLPLVFQHGDPGAWNILVTADGRAALLDWEAAEPQGMPLWDLFYFWRSYAVRAARRKGVRHALRGVATKLLGPSAFGPSAFGPCLARSIADYCRRVGMSPNLAEPLFHTCWMHRALKEATRLPQSGLQQGHYVSLLRYGLRQQNSLTFQRLFSAGSRRSAPSRSPPRSNHRPGPAELPSRLPTFSQ